MNSGKSHLAAVRKNATRWSITFNMVKRYLEIKDSIPIEFAEIADLVPSSRETNVLQNLYSNILNELKYDTKIL